METETNAQFIMSPTYVNGCQQTEAYHTQVTSRHSTYLAAYATYAGNIMIAGDFNIHVDQGSDKLATDFMELMESFGYTQLVNGATHRLGHTLDLIFMRNGSPQIQRVKVWDPLISDHFAIVCEMPLNKPKRSSRIIEYRQTKSIDLEYFRKDITELMMRCHDPSDEEVNTKSVDSLVSTYNSAMTAILDQHAPVKSRKVVDRPECKWFTDEVREAKQKKRQLERLYNKTKLEIHRQMYKAQKNDTNHIIRDAKRSYYSSMVSETKDSRALYSVCNTLLGKEKDTRLPDNARLEELPAVFSDFVVSKIKLLQDSIPDSEKPVFEHRKVDSVFSNFTPVSEDYVKKLVLSLPNKTNELDPIPTGLLKDCVDEIVPVMTRIINTSFSLGLFPRDLKNALVKPLLKKPSLDPNCLEELQARVQYFCRR